MKWMYTRQGGVSSKLGFVTCKKDVTAVGREAWSQAPPWAAQGEPGPGMEMSHMVSGKSRWFHDWLTNTHCLAIRKPKLCLTNTITTQ